MGLYQVVVVVAQRPQLGKGIHVILVEELEPALIRVHYAHPNAPVPQELGAQVAKGSRSHNADTMPRCNGKRLEAGEAGGHGLDQGSALQGNIVGQRVDVPSG